MLQQLLLGFACEAEGAILRVWEARAAGSGCQLLEVGLLGWAAAGVHGCGGVPDGHLVQHRQQGKVGVHEVDGLQKPAVLGSSH